MDPSALNLTTVTGIVAITMLIVEFLKRILKNRAWFCKVPIFVYDIIIAAIIAFFANHIVHKLPGDTLCVMWQSMLAAASSSGLYTWIKNPEPPKTANNINLTPVPAAPAIAPPPPQNCVGDSNAKVNQDSNVSDGPIVVDVRVCRNGSSATIHCSSGQ